MAKEVELLSADDEENGPEPELRSQQSTRSVGGGGKTGKKKGRDTKQTAAVMSLPEDGDDDAIESAVVEDAKPAVKKGKQKKSTGK